MSDPDELIAAARDAEERGEVREAIALLKQAIAMSPQPAPIWAWLGQLHAQDEQFAAAEDAYRHALTMSPTLAAAHSGLAGVLENTNRLEEAEAEYERSIELKPTSPRYVLLGVLQSSRGHDVKAIASLRRALQLEEDNEEAMFNLATLVREDAPAEAEKLLRRALEIDPLYVAAYRELGFLLAGRGLRQEAEDKLRTELSLDRDDRWTPLYLGNVLWAQGKLAEAELIFRQASESAPLWGLPHRLLANVYQENGRVQDALEHYRLAAALAPEDADGAFLLAHLLAALDRSDEASRWVKHALELDKDHLRARALQSRLAGAD